MIEKRNEGGFTLIELLIVIIILAILAAIVVFAVGSTGSNAVAASCNADAKTFETALESYKAEVGYYPGAAQLNSSGAAEINNGQSWAGATAAPAGSLPAAAGAVFGLLGDTGTDAAGQSVNNYPIVNGVNGTVGTWISPTNNALVGSFLRELPSGSTRQHYQIVTDGNGGVFAIAPSASLPSTLSASANYDSNPAVCGNFS